MIRSDRQSYYFMTSKRSASREDSSGRLRVGDDWNAITIIALSQSNPLKAVAEFVENSIDARAANVIITRGRERGAVILAHHRRRRRHTP